MSFAKNIRKAVTKSPSASTFFDFVDDELWGTIGNYAINKLSSGNYKKGLLYGRSIAIGGQSGSGKSLIAATICGHAQKNDNAFILWLDSEKATTGQSGKEWLETLGVDTSDDKLLYAEVATIEDVKGIVADTADMMRKEKSPQPVIIVLDSLGMLLTGSQMEKAEEGSVVGDQGQSAKQKKDLIVAITHLSARIPLMTISILHTMASTDKYNPDEVLTSGRGVQFAASLVLVVNKMKMRVDQLEKSSTLDYSGYESKDVIGIRSKVQVYKSRFAQPNTSIEVQIPYPNGLDPYSGLFNLMREIGEITSPSVGWFSFRDTDGKETKFREKEFRSHADRIMQLADEGKLVAPELVPVVEEEAED